MSLLEVRPPNRNLSSTGNHKCRILAHCHPERSEGPFLRPQRPLATLGVTVTTHPSAIVGTSACLFHLKASRDALTRHGACSTVLIGDGGVAMLRRSLL